MKGGWIRDIFKVRAIGFTDGLGVEGGRKRGIKSEVPDIQSAGPGVEAPSP